MSSPFDSETGAMSSVITPYFTPSLPQETKSKQLKADSKVFIPAYDPTLPREAIVDLLSVSDPDYSEIRALLRSKNYPPFWISSIILSLRRGNGMKRINELRVIRNRRQVDGPTARDVVGKSSKALAPTLFAKGKGNSGALWRIYAPPASPVVKKPETYSHSAFQKWVYGQAALLGRALKRKTQFVTGNHAAQTLFFSVSRFSTDQVIAQMLADANIFVDDYVQISRRPKEYSLADFIPDQPEQPRSLVVDDIVVVDCTQLAALEPAFKRHKPLFRTALSYLARTDIDVPVDVSKLQADIRAKIKLTVVHRQGREICVRIGSTTIHNLEQLQRYRHVFTDNESLFGAVTCYLYKGAQSGLDYNRIQSHLDVVVLYGRVRLDVPFVPPGILRALANPYQLWVEASQVVIQPLDFVESDSDSESSFGLATYAAAIPSLDEVSPFLSSPDGSPRTAVVDPRLYDNDLPFSPHLPDTVNSSLAALPLNDPRREEFMQAYADCLTIEDLIAAMDIITPCRDGYKKGIFARKLSEAAELAQMGVILHAPSPVSSPSFESIFEQLVSMNYQGNTPSIDHHVKVELPENIGDTLVEAVQNVALATGTSLATGYVRPVTQLVALFASLHCAESWGSAISAILQFATGNDFVYRHCSALITRLYKVLESKIFATHQGEGFVSQWFVTPIKEFFSQEVFAEIWDTLASCSIVSLLQQFAAGVTETILPPLKEFIVHLRLSAFREGAKTVVTSILSCITEFFATVKLCWTLKSFAPLWGSKWNPDVWSKEVESMMTYYPLLTSASSSNPVVLAELSQLRADKLVSEFWTTPILLGPFAARCEYYYAQGVAQREYFSKNAALSNSISRLLSRLRSFIDQIVLNMNGSMERVRPLGIGFWGQPGTGKTNLMKQVFKALAAVNNFDTTSAGYYQWVPNANFQDGFDHTKWAVLMDDVDQGVAPPAAGIRNHIEEWLALNNNAPYAIEKAAVEMKGKIYASNVVTGICSNYEDFRVSENCRAPDAFWRRMDYHVEVIASEKFDRGAGLLDPAKAALSDTHDMYILKVRKFDASLAGNPDQKFIPMTQAKIYSFSEFMAELQDYFREHIRRERANLARRADTGPICLVCGLDTSRQCAHQVNFEKIAADDAPKIDIEQIVSVQKQGVEIPVAIAALLATASLSYAAHHASFVNDLKAYFERLKVTQWLDDYKKVISEKCSTIPAKVMAECSRIRLEIQRAVAIAYDAKFFLASAAAVTAVVAAAASAVYFTKHYLQGRDNNAVPGILPSNWVRAEQNFVPGLPMPANQATYTKEDLEKSLRESHIMVKGPKYEMHGFIVAHNTFAVPTHVLLTADGTMGELLILTVANRTISMHVTPLCHKTCPSNPELSLIRCGELKGVGGLASKMWEVVDESVQTFDELELWSDVKVYAPQQNAMRTYNGSRVLTASAPTENGDCGLAYVARFGKAWKVVGFHYLLMETWGITGAKKSAVAALATRMEFAKLASQMGTTLQGIVPVLKTLHPTETVTTLPFPLKSEVWAAMSHHGAQPYPLGEAHPPLPGSSMKTKVTHSLFYNMAKERFEEKWCGQRDYWSLPDFRGRMIDEKWTSPWTNMFKTQNTAEFDEYVMITALADYLSGIEYLDNEGYSGISEEEAIIGIPYSYVGALNLKTSVGPPYNKGKKSFISIIDHQAFIDPRLAILVDDIESVVSELCIPVVLGLACQKDEALKPRKFPRIFTSLPAALNIAMKKRGAWKSFVRANFSFFESAVGINMTSAECNKIIQHLRSVDAELRRLIEKDAMSLDNSFSGRLWDIIALAIYAISFVIGVSPMECFMLAHSQKHTIHGIKGDLFSYFKNPSGSDWTVEVNGLTMSVGERYVYYRGRPELIDRVWVEQYLARFFIDPVPHREFTFRLYVAMATYGDDVLANSVCDIPANYQQIWRDEIGIIVTDASKSVDMKFKTLEEAQFLKRNFVWDEELKMYIPPLDKKSLARMLLMKKDSTLTSPDHAAVVLTECLKESVYHGEAFFLEVFNFAEIAAKEYELRENPYLLLRPYSYWRLQMHLGAFQTWSLREPVSPPQLQGKLVSYPPPPPMTTPSIVNSGNDPAKNDPAPAASTNLSHDVGQVLSTSNVQANTITQPKYFQTLPQNDITDFLTRLTEIATWSIDDSNAPIVMLSIDPWALFLADPKVVEKINNYTYIRGTIELLFVVAIPGNCYGSYVISALPNGGGTAEGGSGVATALTYQNCMQVDHYARIDAAASDNVIMQLPFLWPYDFAALPSGPTNSWIIYLSCLTPLRTAIQGGLSVGSVKVFARLLPDYELSVPHFQGRHSRAGHLTASSTIQKYAPALAAHVVGHTNGKVGKVADEVANVAEKLEGVPLIGPYAATAAKAAHAVGKVAHMFGFTRENHEQTPMPITNRSVTNVAHVDSLDAGESASFMSVNEISIDGTLVGTVPEDPLSTASFFNRWTLIKRITWMSSRASGYILDSIYVTPSLFSTSTGGTFSTTPAGYFGLPFQYYRGGMEYLVIIPVSKLHRGSVQILWVPFASTITANPTNTTLNMIYDVAADEEKEVHVGYARELPFLNNRIIQDTTLIVPTGATNGQLVFRVINPLTATNAATTYADIIVFARAAKDMEFAVPRTFVNATVSGELVPCDIITEVNYQGALGDEEAHTEMPVELVPPAAAYPMDELLFGERIESIRALFQKPSRLIFEVPEPVPPSPPLIPNVYDFYQLGPRITQSVNVGYPCGWTWQSWFRMCFTGMAASERFKIFPMAGMWLGAEPLSYDLGAAPPTSAEFNCPGTLAPMTYCGPNKGAEFVIPYYGPQKYIVNRYEKAQQDNSAGRKNRLWAIPEGEENRIVIYHSFGPDVRVTCFRQIPRVVFGTTSVAKISWFS